MAGKKLDGTQRAFPVEPLPEGDKRLKDKPPLRFPFALVDDDGRIRVMRYPSRAVKICVYASLIGARKGEKVFGGKLIMRGRPDVDLTGPKPEPPSEPDPYEVGPDGGIWERPAPPDGTLRHRYGPEIAPGQCWCGAEQDTPVHQEAS